jgi:flagellar motor switch protein FliG
MLTRHQKAAVIIAQLDDDRAQQIMNGLNDNEVIAITAEVARLPVLSAQEVADVCTEFSVQALALSEVRQGGMASADRLLRERFGPARAAELMEELSQLGTERPLQFLNSIDAAQIVGFLKDEQPQLIAIVVANVSPEHGAEIIGLLDPEISVDVTRRVAKMSPIPADVVRRVGDELEQRLSAFVRGGGGGSELGGVKTVANILNNANTWTEKNILERLDEIDAEVAELIRNEMFVFTDVLTLDDKALQEVLRGIQPATLALAMKGKSTEVISKFRGNMSEQRVVDLDEEMAALGPQRASAVEAAEGEIVKAVRALADAGAITLGRGTDELVD